MPNQAGHPKDIWQKIGTFMYYVVPTSFLITYWFYNFIRTNYSDNNILVFYIILCVSLVVGFSIYGIARIVKWFVWLREYFCRGKSFKEAVLGVLGGQSKGQRERHGMFLHDKQVFNTILLIGLVVTFILKKWFFDFQPWSIAIYLLFYPGLISDICQDFITKKYLRSNTQNNP